MKHMVARTWLCLATVFLLCISFALLAQSSQPGSAQQGPAPAVPPPQTTSAPPQDAGEGAKEGQASAAQPARKQNGAPIPAPILKVTARLVLVDTVVTDHAGQPITDLNAADFQILDNGKSQKVQIFHLQRALQPGSTPAPARQLQQGVYTNIPDTEGASGPPTVLLIDGVNTPTSDQSRMRQQLINFLKRLKPRQNVAIYLLGRDLRLLQDFTDDPVLLRSVLDKFNLSSATVHQDPEIGPDDMFIRDFGEHGSDAMMPIMIRNLREFETEQLSRETDDRVAITTAALRRIAQILAGYPGRKNLIWLSGAFPMTIVPDQTTRVAYEAQRNYAAQINAAASILTDAQVALYTVDVRGLVDTAPGTASSGRDITGNLRRDQAYDDELARRSRVETDTHAAENELSEQTGGRAYYNSNDIDKALQRSVADGSTYYVLGYYPVSNQWDGKFHKIQVKVARKGLEVRSRHGYFAYDLAQTQKFNESQARMDFLAALSPGTPAMTGLPFMVSVAPPDKAGSPVTVQYSVEPHSIALEDQKRGQLDFVIRAFDTKGKQVGNQSQTLNLDLQPERLAAILKQGLRITQTIALPSGKYLLKLGIRDAKSNVIGTVSAVVQVPQS